jgi:hypothetical protein
LVGGAIGKSIGEKLDNFFSTKKKDTNKLENITDDAEHVANRTRLETAGDN